jgi:hypothetical protein
MTARLRSLNCDIRGVWHLFYQLYVPDPEFIHTFIDRPAVFGPNFPAITQ